MDILIEKDALLKSLTKVQGVVEKRNTMPILSNTLVRCKDNELEIIATDLDVTIMDRLPAEVKSSGSVTLSARKLYEISKELPEGKISMKDKGESKVEIKGEKGVFDLLAISSDEFPEVSDISEYSFVEVEAAVIMEMIDKTIYSSAGEEARFNLNGIYVEKVDGDKVLRMVATDGHRLAMIDRELGDLKALNLKGGVIMPRKGMAELKKLLEGHEGKIEFGIKENNAAARINGTVLIMRLIDGDFPEYQRVIPEDTKNKATVKRENLLKTIRLASILADEKIRAVKFRFTKNHLEIKGKSASFGEATGDCDIEYEGKEVEVGFNDRYLIDIINSVPQAEKIHIEMKDELSPSIVRADNDDKYTCVVMPMRL